MLARLLHLINVGALATSETVTIERYRLYGVIISAVASVVAAVLGYINSRAAREAKREARAARREARARRHVVRNPDSEHALVVDAKLDPPEPPEVDS